MPDQKSAEEYGEITSDNKENIPAGGSEDFNAGDSQTERVETPENTPTEMEIFHPHKVHHDRKIKDYIFEFIMLFLAISGGFFMENKREQMVERHKEKEYISSLIGDIQQDTATIQNIIKKNYRQLKGLDSLLVLLEKPYTEIDIERLYNLTIRYLNNYNGFAPHDITMIQLKNSGELRLIENKPASDKIVGYYSTIDHFHELNVKMNYRFIEDSYNLELSFFDLSPFHVNGRKYVISDPSKLVELYNRTTGFKSGIEWDNHWMTEVNDQGTSLLKYLREVYKIKG